jgi:hypothetical protein
LHPICERIIRGESSVFKEIVYMQLTESVDSEATRRPGSRGVLLALLLGGIMASLTLSIEGLGAPSEIPMIGDPRPVLVTLLFPGMLGSMAVSGNAHAWHLWVAALVNGLVYFGLGWVGSRVIASLFRRVRKIGQ